MQKGELRKEIMDGCPEEFENSLKNSVDKLEGLLNAILNKFEINSITDISNVEDACNLVDDLCDSLY